MDIRVRAALYSIGYFVGILVLASILNVIAPYLEAWMGYVAIFGLLFYAVYQLMLAKLNFDNSLDKVTKNGGSEHSSNIS
jgi:hypothetical protein